MVKNKKLFATDKEDIKKIFSSPWLLSILWIIPIITTVLSTGKNLLDILYAVSSVLLIILVLYGGHFLIARKKAVGVFPIFIALITWLTLFLLPISVDEPSKWFISAIIIFIMGMIFHSSIILSTHDPEIKEFCNFKLLVEIFGIGLFLIGFFLNLIWGDRFWIGLASLFCMFILDYIIFFKSNIYS